MKNKPTELAIRVARYLKRTGMKPSRFGRLVNGDPCLVLDLLAGREPRRKTAERIESFIREHR